MKPASQHRVTIFLSLIVAVGVATVGVSLLARVYIHRCARDRVFTDIARVPQCRVALVLGARVHPNGSLSVLLADRVNAAIDLYKAGKVSKLLMSGDNRFRNYNEPDRMREYAVSHGVPASDVATDYAGRRTYDSVYRARHIFGLDHFVIVSQGFHLDRAIFICKRMKIDAYGFSADHPGRHTSTATLRELPACLGAMVDTYVRHPRPVMGKREGI